VTANLHNALLIPQRAVSEMQGSYQVAVVGSDNKVSIRSVKVGERVGSNWIIREGLQPDELVVIEGVQKIGEGSPVKPTEVMPVDGAASPAGAPAAAPPASGGAN
jgi:membrane fusion protein (multidrug efflux system)